MVVRAAGIIEPPWYMVVRAAGKIEPHRYMVVRAAGKIVRSWLGGMMVGGVGGDSVGSEERTARLGDSGVVR